MSRKPMNRAETAAMIRAKQVEMVEKARQELKEMAVANVSKPGKES